MTRERLWPAVLTGWLLAAVVLCVGLAPAITHLTFPDPDDAMRLLEVRDWLGGQSWWDVGQHRLNGGQFAMHWSRLVDLPLAAVMLLFDPLVGTAASTRIAMTLVPLGTLLAVMGGAAVLTDKVAGRDAAKWAVLLAAMSSPLIFQLRPMRIDHHGWQVALALAAIVPLVQPPTAGRGALSGLALATLVTISLEGLPVAAVLAAVPALRWAWTSRGRAFVRAQLVTWFTAALALHGATRGPAMLAIACDAMSPGWLAALGAAALGVAAVTSFPPASATARLAALAAAAAATGIALVATAPQCLAGPFATLDPLVRTIWYDQVTEGLPLWRQDPAWAVITVALPIVGIVGAMIGAVRSRDVARERWLSLLAVLVPATVLAVMVNRSGATANALALPGAASVLVAMLARARAIPSAVRRTAATAVAMLAASPGLAAAAAMAMFPPMLKDGVGQSGASRVPCSAFSDVRVLRTLPTGVIFLPLDVTPDLVATTGHRAISGGYHRNVGAMHSVLSAFTGTPENARRVIAASGATYVAGCPGLNETVLYKRVNPNGFWAQLERGERFDWLSPVQLHGAAVLAWRVRR